jgi:Kdo2-lipid IVA lauroyltransferase/acyltransferase
LSFFLTQLLRLIGHLPLAWLQALGRALGPILLRLDRRARLRLRENLAYAQGYFTTPVTERQVAASLAESLLELPWLWTHNNADLIAHTEIDAASLACLQAAQATIFLTPHVGSFEVVARVIAEHRPLTLMYRSPKIKGLNQLMLAGRSQGHSQAVPADLTGVRMMMKALKQGEAIGILPDQVPVGGDGLRVDFFGRPARTITLVAKFAQKTEARVVMATAIRVAGIYRLLFDEIQLPLGSDADCLTAMNEAVEQAILRAPEQYLWTYNRYK